eukprot:1149776-Pelagomonas_calceolata.AAC.2
MLAAEQAAVSAISSPLLDIGIEKATGVVWNITGPADMTLFEVRKPIPSAKAAPTYRLPKVLGRECSAWKDAARVNEAAETIYELVDPNANLIFGAVVDPALGDAVMITIMATGEATYFQGRAPSVLSVAHSFDD